MDPLSSGLYLVVGIPALPFALLWYLTLRPATAALGVVLVLVVAVGTFLHGSAANRCRPAERAPTIPG